MIIHVHQKYDKNFLPLVAFKIKDCDENLKYSFYNLTPQIFTAFNTIGCGDKSIFCCPIQAITHDRYESFYQVSDLFFMT